MMSSSAFSSQSSQVSHSNSQILMNLPQSQQPPQMMNRNYGMWGPPPQTMDLPMNYQNPNPNRMKTQTGGFVSGGKHPLGPRINWKGKKKNKPDNRMDLGRRMDKPLPIGGSTSAGVPGNLATGGGYKPPTLNELQHQNRMKARRYFPKKNFNKNNHNMGKFAPRNTTSFIIRAKKSGGIADLVSPCPVTPAVLPTPMFSPSREVLVDMAKEEWGVDGYGSMKGLIRLRSPGHETVEGHDDDEEDEGGSSESDVEEHVEVERRLDHDLSRFEMIYPNYRTVGGVDYNNVLENRVDDQDTHIAQLEEENLILKERLFLMERELDDLRRRLQCLERQNHGGEEINEEVVENESENESESRGDAHSMEVNNGEMTEENVEVHREDKNHELEARRFQIEQKIADVKENDENEKQVVDVEIKPNIEVSVNLLDKNENEANGEAPEDYKDNNVNAVEDNNAILEVLEESRHHVQKDVLMQESMQTGQDMVAENPNKEAAGSEKSIGEGSLSDCPSSL